MSDGAAIPKKMREELKEFAANRGIEIFSFKVRTVTTSVDVCVSDDVDKAKLTHNLHTNAKVLGLLRHLVSVYLNTLVDDPAVSSAGSRIVFNAGVLRHIFLHLATYKMRAPNERSDPRILDLDIYADVKNHLVNYVHRYYEDEEHGLPPQTLEKFRGCIKRPLAFLSRNMSAANKRHVEDQFDKSAVRHIQCFIEQRFWNDHGLDHFQTLTKYAARALFNAAMASTVDQAAEIIDRFCDRNAIPGWREGLLDMMPMFRALFEDVRELASPTSKLRVLWHFRREVRPLYDEALRVRSEVDNAQPHVDFPSVLGKYDKQKIIAQRNKLKQVPVPPWFGTGEPITDRDVQDLKTAVTLARKKLFNEKKVPGLDSLPKPFTLLPSYSLKHAFVHYDNESVRQLARGVIGGDELLNAGSRTWWTQLFDFHSKRKIDRYRPPPVRANGKKRKIIRRKGLNKLPRQRRKKKKKKRKLLRQKKILRQGIPLCVQHSWVPDDVRYNEEKSKEDGAIPWLVCNISSDGLQVKVLLATITKKEHTEVARPSDESTRHPRKEPLPSGVRELHEKGYYTIRRRFDISRNTKGLFKNAVRVPEDFHGKYHVIGLDPGQVKIGTTVRAEVDLSLGTREEVKNAMKVKDLEQSSTYVSHKTYRFESLARAAEKNEAARRTQNASYRAALEEFSQVTLKRAGSSTAYANVVYSTLTVMCRELLSRSRRRQRFARFRAKSRNIQEMAKTLAFGAENHVLRTSASRGAAKRKLKQDLYRRKRVVFFGNAEFGHGSRGPCPRKRLLRALSLLCPVVLVDEFRTSICCKECGNPLQGNHRSRVFRCTINPTGESNGCSVESIDRDTNGATNIATVGLHQLLGLPRPPHLSRPSRSSHA